MKEVNLYIGDKIIFVPYNHQYLYTFTKSQINDIIKSDFDYNIYSEIVNTIRQDYPYYHNSTLPLKVISYFEKGYYILENSDEHSFSVVGKEKLHDMLCSGTIKIDMKNRRLLTIDKLLDI